ncbi:MAG: MFS transporter, partial [Longimicrobiales bacterium]
LLGWSSLFTDAATEMIYPLLPVYLSRVLGAGALSLGIIEGVAEAINSVLKVVSGYLSDRWTRRRPIVIAGYTVSSAARPFIALTATWPQVLLVRALDRMGKGIRGAPRDAMLARFASPSDRGRIFGFHRAMDHAGAIVGPLVASAILLAAPGELRLVFALTIVPGAIAVALLFLVPEPEAAGPLRGTRPTYEESAHGGVPRGGAEETHIGRVPRGAAEEAPSGPAGTSAFARLPKRLLAFLAVLLLFSLGNSADAFLLLRVSEALGSATYIPLLWSAFHVVKASLSTGGGALSDRLGRRQVIVIGWTVYAVVYLGFALAEGAAALVGWFLIYGVYFALTEGAEKALVADLTPAGAHGTAFGLYNAALGAGTLAASIAFGVLYERFGAAAAFGTGSALAAAAAIVLLLIRTDKQQDAMMVGSNV